jgi:5-methyltetrahydrofolate--homocysteine methyltransferase
MLDELKDSVVVGNSRKAQRIAELLINKGISANKAVNKLVEAMKTVDERYERKDYFVIDVASAASAMQVSFKILEPYLEVEPSMAKGRVVIGSLKGNVQGLGKDIIAATLQSAGFLVRNLGVNVAPEDFEGCTQ